MAEVDICVVLRLIFIDFMGLCNYPTGMAASVNRLPAARRPAGPRNRNVKYTGPNCAYAIIEQTSDLDAFPFQSSLVLFVRDKVIYMTLRGLIDCFPNKAEKKTICFPT